MKLVTRDGTAKKDKHYSPPEEEVVFETGEVAKEIKVPLLKWAPDDSDTVDFFVDVFEDKDDTGHEIGHEIQVCVRERDRDKERETETKRERETDRERRESACVRVCV